MVAQNVFFYLFAALIVGSAIAVVTTRNVVRAALYLVTVFVGVVAQYLLLAAEFVAVTQILIYIGAIMVLMLFGIMLTRARIGRDFNLTNSHWFVGLATAVVLLGVMGYALVDAYGDDPLPRDTRIDGVAGSNTATLSDAIFSQYLVPFEVVSVLLLAALVGAIVLARKDRA
jgi:NADH-quinone oxidoreductase subunit J